jgi:hypothetical protein
MARHTELVSNPERHIGLSEKNNGISMTTAIIGTLIYFVFLIPTLSLIVVGTLDLSDDYIIPLTIAWGFVGLYVAENYACRDIQS